MDLFQAFRGPSQQNRDWFSVGLSSSFPDLGTEAGEGTHLAHPLPCKTGQRPGCVAFQAPENGGKATEVAVGQEALEDTVAGADLKDQVLVFQYRGKFHAIDHVSGPHQLPIAREYARCSF